MQPRALSFIEIASHSDQEQKRRRLLVLYILAQVYEDLNDEAKVIEAYEKLFVRHP